MIGMADVAFRFPATQTSSSGLFQGSVTAKLLSVFSDTFLVLESYFDMVQIGGIFCRLHLYLKLRNVRQCREIKSNC